ncbi:MAG: glycosyl transferase group 1 [uncultured bacterium]|nr:MAG: glycosyl transferase group 1 [uncultured bacterium]
MFNIFRKKIKVAVVSPSFGNTGGPEVVAQNLVNALVDLGVDVTLFAPADWKTKARHIPTLKKSIWNMPNIKEMSVEVLRNFRISSQVKILNYQDDFDVVHLHSQKYAYSVGKNLRKPCVLSFHNRFSKDVFDQIKSAGIYTIALSNSQKGSFDVSEVIYNGVPTKNINYSFKEGRYLMFVGRLTDQKGVDIAIQIALKANKKLLIFGRIGNSEERQKFYKEKVQPYLDDKNIIYKGEVSHEKIYEYLREAEALLFPIRRPEVCPMAVGESLACGTPVIGTQIDPLMEMLTDEKVSFLSNDVDELVESVKNTQRFDRRKCRKYAEEKFDSLVMAKRYLDFYEKIIRDYRK